MKIKFIYFNDDVGYSHIYYYFDIFISKILNNEIYNIENVFKEEWKVYLIFKKIFLIISKNNILKNSKS